MTAEFAVALPSVVLVLLLVVGFAVHGAAQVSLEDGARAAARELARGESEEVAVQTARRTVGADVEVSVSSEGGYARVQLSRPVRLLGVVELDASHSAEASARVEHIRGDRLPRGRVSRGRVPTLPTHRVRRKA
ncbi:TadE family type IV pilus minor pilin [Nesterenkonia alba]|uniref:TadE family type IV pilus minor pilin n=1 Tax=Nesterenkonia alba TaxID=515814 RepID=UPI00041FA3B9|nr:TadE family type IV pilus minor pilin [Nesterenkonia alba]